MLFVTPTEQQRTKPKLKTDNTKTGTYSSNGCVMFTPENPIRYSFLTNV